MSCRFPGGALNPEMFWDNLVLKKDCIRPVPPERWNHDRFYHPHLDAPGYTPAREGGFLEQVLDFDPGFFGISPREAESMDPQQRLLMELSYEAIERAGLTLKGMRGSSTGVFLGLSTCDWGLSVERFSERTHSATGRAPAITANRISYTFDFRGPSLSLDTACSSALVALNVGCRSLLNRECDYALVGAVNLMIDPAVFMGFSRLHMLSPSNRCRAFDSRADGYVRSEGGGVLVLRRLDQALAEGQRVEAVLLATGLNQDGKTSGITAPNPSAQVALLERLYQGRDWTPRLEFLECHGTGTPVGDPVEAASVGTVLGRPEGLWLGSVKTNIGHLEAAAGMAGVIKAILCLRHRQIPPNLHFQTPPETIDLQGLGLRIPTRLESLAPEAVIGVNAFGFGGANAHAVLGPPPSALKREGRARHHLLTLSARCPAALKERVSQFRALLENPESPTLEDLAYSCSARSPQHPYRAAFTGRDLEEVLLELEEPSLVRASTAEDGPVFVFCGQGPQWPGMAVELWNTQPVFARVLDRLETFLEELGGWSLRALLEAPASSTRLAQTCYAQPAIFALQVGLFELWKSWGIRPSAVVGHSVGEVAAAYAAGILSLEEGLRVIFHRSSQMEAASTEGGMLAVQASWQEVESLLAEGNASLEIGARNGPYSTAVSGPVGAIHEFEDLLQLRELTFKRVPVQYAFHSALMAPVEKPLLAALGEVVQDPPATLMISSVTGKPVEEGQLDAVYWWNNVRRTVSFQDAVEQLLQRGHDRFLEVGPHPVLAADLLACAHQQERPLKLFASLIRRQAQTARMYRALGELWCEGLPVDWESFHQHGNPVRLPLYPWQRQTYDHPDRVRIRGVQADSPSRLLGSQRDHGLPTWLTVIDERVHPFMADHRFDGRAMLSATTYIELAFQAAATRAEEPGQVVLTDLRFEAPLFLQPQNPSLVQTCLNPDQGSLDIHGLQSQSRWLKHMSGHFQTVPSAPRPPAPKVSREGMVALEKGWVEAPLQTRLLEYGPTFRTLGRAWVSETEVLSEVEWPCEEEFLLHPCGLDACLQSVIGLSDFSLAAEQSVVFPYSIERVRRYGVPRGPVWCYLVGEPRVKGSHRRADFLVYDEEGVLISVEGVLWKLPEVGSGRGMAVDRMLLEVEWQPLSEPSSLADPEIRRAGPGRARLNLVEHSGAGRWIFAGDPAVEPLDQLEQLLELVRNLEKDHNQRLALVTFGAHSVTPGEAPNLRQAPLTGFFRALQRELPGLNPLLRDLPLEPAPDDLRALAGSLSLEAEPEITIRGGELLARRWRGLSFAQLDRRAFEAVEVAGNVRAVIDRPGSLERISWRTQELEDPGPGHLLLEVEATGLNFSDVLKGLDLYPVEDRSLGSECVGKVLKVGPGVEAPKVGQRVVALGRALMAGRALVAAELTAPCPQGMKASEAAALPLVHTTATLCLKRLAGLQEGERILIHSATGGVGQAALALARELNCEIYATAGSEAKREQLRRSGVAGVYDSRDPSFADRLLADCDGVDVVLNSLSGAGLERSLECMRPFGRFVEIGKSDLYANRRLGLRPLCRGQQFLTFDLALWMEHRTQEVGAVLRQVVAGSRPLATAPYPRARLSEALQTMAAGEHRGKLAVVAEGPLEVGRPSEREPRLDPLGAYLISGGLTGLGAALARRLVDYGARHLLLVGRRGPATPGADRLVAELEEAGAQVQVLAADIAHLEALPPSTPPLRGIFHAANQMDDGTLLELDRSRLERVYRPKAVGAWNLHRLSQSQPVEHFVLFSSASSALGAAGQANYCAANAYLDSLAQLRRAEGLPVLSVNWGPIHDSGYLARHPKVLEHLRHLGHEPLSTEECLDTLALLMVLKPTPVLAARIEGRLLGQGEETPTALAPEDFGPFLRKQVERILRISSLDEQSDRPLREFGLDSLMAVELRNSIEQQLRVQLPMRTLLAGPSLTELRALIEEQLQQ